MTSLRLSCAIALSALFVCACTPKIYVVDRQTELEDVAAGEWPQFEKEVVSKAAMNGPTPFSKTPPSAEKAKLYNILNGELVSEASLPAVHQGKTK